MRYAWDKRRDPILGIAGIPGGIGGIPPGMRRQVTPPIYQKSQVGMAGSRLGLKTGSHLGYFIIPGGIPGGIPPRIPPGIPCGNGGIPPGIKDGIPSGMFHNPRRDPTWDRPGIPGGIGGIPPLNFTWMKSCMVKFLSWRQF